MGWQQSSPAAAMPMPSLFLTLVALVPAAAVPVGTCASWCARDALGQSHCTHPECQACEKCATIVSCTPSKVGDLSHESCSPWCKQEHKQEHCVACSCKTCPFCTAPGSAAAAEPADPNAASPPPAPDARVLAENALSSLARALVKSNIAWDDAFKPFDRKGNGVISSSEVQRVFHNHGIGPLPLHGLPSTISSLHGIDFRALHRLIPAGRLGGLPAAPPPPPAPTPAAAVAALAALADALASDGTTWAEAFRPYDRAADDAPLSGLIGASDLEALFTSNGLSPLPLHMLPPSVTTLHGVDYNALHALLPTTTKP